jgi:transposase
VLSVSLKIDKIEYGAVVKFFVKEGLTPNEIHSKFIKVYGDSSPSFLTIKKWPAEFKYGRTSLEDDPRAGRPKSATTPEIIEQVNDMVLDDGLPSLNVAVPALKMIHVKDVQKVQQHQKSLNK